jgi:hypothetical protein
MRESLRKRIEALEAKQAPAKTTIIGGFRFTEAEIDRMVCEIDGRTRDIPTMQCTRVRMKCTAAVS